MEIKGSLGVNKTQLINLLGSKMYRSDVQNVAVKELIQNAFDAAKIAVALGQIDRPHITVDINYSDRSIIVSDNGVGMTPDIVQKAFFTIGGSDKGGVDNRLRSGGLGLAKMAFLFSSERISLCTTRNGVMTCVDTTPSEIQNDAFVIRTDYTSSPNGTTVKIDIPRDYIDENGESRYISFSDRPSFLSYPLLWNGIDLTINGNTKKTSNVPDGYAALGIAKSDFGDIEIFVKPIARSRWGGSYVESEVFISGLRQFRKSFYIDNKSNIAVILNILPSVDTSSRVYPINNTREDFNAVVNPEVDDIKWLIKKINALMEKRKARDMFANKIASSSRTVSDVSVEYDPATAFNEVISQVQTVFTPQVVNGNVQNVIAINVLHEQRKADENHRQSSMDFSGIDFDVFEVAPIDTSNLDITKPIFHNNTNMIIESDGQRVMDEIGDLMLQLKKLYMDVYPSDPRLVNQYWGISLDTRYLGIHVNQSIINLLAINPFLGVKIRENTNPIEARTEAILHEIMHEFAHNARSYHDAEFCFEMLLTYAAFAGIGTSFIQWKDRLRNCVSRNIATIAKYECLYKQASNVSDGFDCDD